MHFIAGLMLMLRLMGDVVHLKTLGVCRQLLKGVISSKHCVWSVTLPGKQ